jgi:hypothetical protein
MPTLEGHAAPAVSRTAPWSRRSRAARARHLTRAHLLPTSRVRSPILVVPLCCALFARGEALAQDTIREFREAHGEFGSRATSWAPVSLVGTWLPEGTIHKEPGEFDLTQVTLDAVVPIPQSRDTFFTAGILAAARHYDFDGVPVLADDTLHRFGVRLGYGGFVNDDLMLQGYWQPSIYSDLDGTLKSEDYRLWYGTFLGVYRESRDWFWKLGVIATDAVDTGVLPLAGFTWHLDEHWSVQVLLPRDVSLVWSAPGWNVFTGFLVESDEYHVRSPVALGLEDDVHVQELLAHVTVERHLAGGLSLLLRGGSSIAGNYDYGYGNGTDDLTGTLEPTWFVAGGLTFRF